MQFANDNVTFWTDLRARLVLVYFAHLDDLTLNTWRWDDSSLFWDAPFPWPGVLDAHSPPLSSVWCLNRQGRGPTMHLPCVPHLDIPSPLAAGIHPQSPPHRVRRWVDLVVSPSLNLALHQRLQASIHSLSTTRLPDGVTFYVNAGPDVFVYGRGCSPEHARFWSLSRWGHDPLPYGRPARHLGLPESCRFCDASVGDLWHSLSKCPEFADLRAQWSRRCRLSPQFAQAWSRHSWIFDPFILFSIRLVRYVLTSLLLVLFVNGLTRPEQFDFSLVRFCHGGPLLAVSRCEWPWVVLCA